MPQALAVGAAVGSGLGANFAAPSAAPSAGVLFGQLVQAGVGAENAPDAQSLGQNAAEPNLSGTALNPTTPNPQSTVTLGGLPIQIEGTSTEAQAVQVLSQTIMLIYQQLTEQGFQFKTSAEEQTADLAAALTNLGIPAEQAQGLAEKIDTMLGLLAKQLEDQQQSLSADLGTSLIAVLVAALLPQPNNFNLSAQALENQTPSQNISFSQTTVQISIRQTSTQVVQFAASSADFASARDALFLPATPPQAPIRVQLKAEAAPQVALAVLPQTLTQAPVQIVLPEVLPPTGDTLQSAKTIGASATQSAAFTPVVQSIATPAKIEGTTLYKLTETPTGTAVLQALAPAPIAALAANPTLTPEPTPTPQAATAQALEPLPDAALDASATDVATTNGFTNAATLGLATPPRFAERLAQAQQHQALQQVAIAIQPLLNNGQGGAVRMTLNPPELGRIEIHLKIEAGQVSGAIAATEPAVVEHLARELPALRQALADAGLRLGDQGLSLMLGQNPDGRDPNQPNPFAGNGQNGQGQRRGDANHSGPDEAHGTLGATPSGVSRWVAPERVLDTEV